jgi:hypothetical protein
MIKFLLDRWSGKKTKKNSYYDKINEINYETDSLRFTYDAYLTEFNSVRSEIELRILLQEKTINYLLIIVAAAISAAQIFKEQALDLRLLLNFHPFIYLIIAILLLYFPYSIIFNNIFLAILGSYEHGVLYPKINTIARILSRHSEGTQEFLEWERKNFPQSLRGTLKWDKFRAMAMYEGFGMILFGMFGFFELIFVGSPATIFVISFLRLKLFHETTWTMLEIILFSIFIIIFLFLIIGLIFGTKTFFEIHREYNS